MFLYKNITSGLFYEYIQEYVLIIIRDLDWNIIEFCLILRNEASTSKTVDKRDRNSNLLILPKKP